MNLRLKEGLLSPTLYRILFLIASIAALFSRFFSPNLLLGFYQDDFFYYLQIVKNLATHGISSFDGIHLTNGYHPLWLLTLLALYRLLPGISFFIGLQVVTLIATLAFYAGTERVLRVLSVSEPVRSVLTFFISLQALLLLRYGMEITLALPLAIWLVYFFLQNKLTLSTGRILGIGFLASLTVLARLDAIILVCLLVLSNLYVNRCKAVWRWLILFSVGFIPVFIYFAVNYHFFHIFMPVSGHAKQLKAGLFPSPVAVLSLMHPMDRMKMVFILPSLTLLALGFIFAWKTVRTLPKSEAGIVLTMLVFPVAHLTVLSVVSDWTLWPWYFYPFVFSSLAALIIFARLPVLYQGIVFYRWLRPLTLSLVFIYLIYIVGYSILKPNSTRSYISSAELSEFMDAHPGIYAMGDAAGIPGYLSHQPIIQLEGLVMDSNYLNKIKRREPLKQILADYGANYYVAISPSRAGACLALREPAQAGPSSPASSGKVCSPPIATFYSLTVPIYVFHAQSIR
jgi:hypothetical protein